MKKFALLILACLPLMGSAAGKLSSATMQVSFTVAESCTVQSAGPHAQVQCTADTPYRLVDHAAGQASLRLGAADGEPTVVYF